jgi:hypothetical protein
MGIVERRIGRPNRNWEASGSGDASLFCLGREIEVAAFGAYVL